MNFFDFNILLILLYLMYKQVIIMYFLVQQKAQGENKEHKIP